MIALKDVAKTYQIKGGAAVEAVRRVSLGVERGEFVVITGRSGSGKTTLLNLTAGLTRPTAGEVWLQETNLWSLPDRQQSLLRNGQMGFVFQFPSLLPSLTSLENVALPTIFSANGERESAYERAAGLLDEVGLADKQRAYPRQLSAGQQQRVVVARALMNRPQLLLADEPTSDLDEQTEQEIMQLFGDIHRRLGVTILMVTHTTQLVGYGTRAIHMAAGRIESDRPC
jgi:ABC-type lipoprotein export system ATPase subunit